MITPVNLPGPQITSTSLRLQTLKDKSEKYLQVIMGNYRVNCKSLFILIFLLFMYKITFISVKAYVSSIEMNI